MASKKGDVGLVRKRNNRRSLIEIGERSIIEIIKKRLDAIPASPVPFGDDVAAVTIQGERVAVLKTDMLVGKTDVPDAMSLRQAARKAVVMNVSDFAAKGAEPSAVLVSLGLPRTFSTKDVEEIAEGLNMGAREYGAYVVGGDTSEACDLIVAVSLYGTALKSKLMLRSGAKPGDVVAVTGLFGKPAAGLQILSKNVELVGELHKALVDSVLMPHARLKEGLALSESGAVSASIDSSDGLAWSLHELTRMSGRGFVIDRVPLAEEARRFAESCQVDALELALYGGEEYELVVAVKPERWRETEAAVEAVDGSLFPIGMVTQQKQVVLEKDGKKRLIEPRGWEHFKSKA
ncbi:MAG TPA: thiamine-phosphate kinase [Candidatus Bathyarchaeia archaeon]|nr:thiamine-phosphate kinase [Candidatus Bathyarchaeia archaeon]